MYSNFNLWSKLNVCAVGRSWPADFYSWISDAEIRNLFEKMALEAEEDFQKLIKCLTGLGVTVLRSDVVFEFDSVDTTCFVPKPPMCPRDHMIMLGNTLIETTRGTTGISIKCFDTILDHVKQQGNKIESATEDSICGAMIYQLNDRIFFSSYPYTDTKTVRSLISRHRPNTKILPFCNHGHIDGWFAPVNQNLIISSTDKTRPELLDLFYRTCFPDSQVLYLDPSLCKDSSLVAWPKNNQGRWLIPGQEHNLKLSGFINQHFDHWLGQISETVFELNMIIVDDKNVIVSNYNETLFKNFEQHGITAHVCEFRHQKFWDAGLACLTCELDRGDHNH